MGDVLKNMELDDTRDGPRASTGPPRKGLRGSGMMKDLDADRADKPSHAKVTFLSVSPH
jgi:hypothetical protein